MRCIHCQYPLVNLPVRRCPECGKAFDPDDADTFDGRSPQELAMGRIAWRWMACMYALIACIIFVGNIGDVWSPLLVIAALIGSAVMTALLSPLLLLPLVLAGMLVRRGGRRGEM